MQCMNEERLTKIVEKKKRVVKEDQHYDGEIN